MAIAAQVSYVAHGPFVNFYHSLTFEKGLFQIKEK